MRRPRAAWMLFALLAIVGSLPAAAQTPEEEPRYIGAMLKVGADTFEPTIGADAAGNLYFAEASSGGVAVGYKAGMRLSKDRGATWSDISPKIQGRNVPLETNDPYIYVDPETGRAFNFHMSPILACATVSFSDDQGQSWTTNPAGCFPTGAWDHQTMVAATPRLLKTTGYANILHQCVNTIYAAMCSRSLDGGLTWSPNTLVHLNEDVAKLQGAQHGHLAAAPDGTLYLPTALGGDVPTVYVSRDDGLTWTKRTIANIDTPWTDPSISVDAQGTVYAAFVDEAGVLYMSTSKDFGATWTPAVAATQGITATLPVINVGDPGRIVISYPGTDDLTEGWGSDVVDGHAEAWGAFMTISYNALADTPTFETIEVSGNDPLERGASCARGGRCSYQVDFIEAIIGPDGRPYASFADGCTSTNCINNPSANNNESYGNGVVATLTKMPMPLCEQRCHQYGTPPA